LSLNSKWWAGGLSFATVFGFWCINYIAAEIEMPFGDDENDLPVPSLQKEMNRDLKVLIHNLSQSPPDFQYQTHMNDHLYDIQCDSSLIANLRLSVEQQAEDEASSSYSPTNSGHSPIPKKKQRKGSRMSNGNRTSIRGSSREGSKETTRGASSPQQSGSLSPLPSPLLPFGLSGTLSHQPSWNTTGSASALEGAVEMIDVVLEPAGEESSDSPKAPSSERIAGAPTAKVPNKPALSLESPVPLERLTARDYSEDEMALASGTRMALDLARLQVSAEAGSLVKTSTQGSSPDSRDSPVETSPMRSAI